MGKNGSRDFITGSRGVHAGNALSPRATQHQHRLVGVLDLPEPLELFKAVSLAAPGQDSLEAGLGRQVEKQGQVWGGKPVELRTSCRPTESDW